jgi:hypothetical protein
MKNNLKSIINVIKNEYECYKWSYDCLIDQNIGEDNFIYFLEDLYDKEDLSVASIINDDIEPKIEMCFESEEIDFFGAQVCIVYLDEEYNIRSMFVESLDDYSTKE